MRSENAGEGNFSRCEICPHHCKIEEGQVGLCKGRRNQKGEIISDNYVKLTALS